MIRLDLVKNEIFQPIRHNQAGIFNMFQSFFPQPKLFFSSLALWSAVLILVWYSFGKTIGEALGFDLTETETVTVSYTHLTLPTKA